MKISHIILLVSIAIAIGIIISMSTDAGTYGTFQDAQQLAQKGKQKSIQVMGELTRDPQGQLTGINYQPSLDPNHFEFTMVDTLGRKTRVVYNKPKPQDFEMSEKIVVSGYMQGDVFMADKILMKCPSKYEDEAEFKEA